MTRNTPELVTDEEWAERMGKVTPEHVFMTALAMLLNKSGGEFKYNRDEFNRFRAEHAFLGQLGILVDGDTITVFLYEQEVARA